MLQCPRRAPSSTTVQFTSLSPLHPSIYSLPVRKNSCRLCQTSLSSIILATQEQICSWSPELGVDIGGGGAVRALRGASRCPTQSESISKAHTTQMKTRSPRLQARLLSGWYLVEPSIFPCSSEQRSHLRVWCSRGCYLALHLN